MSGGLHVVGSDNRDDAEHQKENRVGKSKPRISERSRRVGPARHDSKDSERDDQETCDVQHIGTGQQGQAEASEDRRLKAEARQGSIFKRFVQFRVFPNMRGPGEQLIIIGEHAANMD